MRRFASVLAVATLCIGGCSTDQLLIHVQDTASGAPIAGASVELRPAIALLPPPVWRGKTNGEGDLHIWVDFDIGPLQMHISRSGHTFGTIIGRNLFDAGRSIEDNFIPREGGAELTYTVRLIDPK